MVGSCAITNAFSESNLGSESISSIALLGIYTRKNGKRADVTRETLVLPAA
jgi:hypothetical protein